MKKRNLNRIVIIICILFAAIPVASQINFAYKAALGEIKETKFYKIDLPPALVAKCKPGLGDIRILDKNGNQVPYILRNDLPAFRTGSLTEFPIVRNIREGDKQTHVVLQNATNKQVSNLLLFIRNTDARRSFSVSGSDDSSHWFIIKENVSLENTFNTDGQNFIQTLSFPPSDYKYFQLTILGENLLPFNIVKAGIYDEDIVYGKYVKIPAPVILQKDSSNKKSYILLNFNDTYKINKLGLEVEGVKYFRRKLSLQEGSKASDDLLVEDYLCSDSTNSFAINGKNNQFLVIIINEDNIPLKVKAVQAFQLNTWLLAYLQGGERYTVNFGDSVMRAPKYDLNFFSDSIEKDPTEIPVTTIEKNNRSTADNNRSSPKNNHIVLWIIMVAVFIILCLFTFKMLREVNKKVDDNQL